MLQLYLILKGLHLSVPFTQEYFYNEVADSGYFIIQDVYNLHTADQDDWNKMTGYKMDLNSPPDRSVMIAWRWDTLENKYEIAPYFNYFGIEFPKESEIIKVDLNKPVGFKTSIKNRSGKITIWNECYMVEKNFKIGEVKDIYSINPYFGGTSTAPNNIRISIFKY